jgi:hypothetical protein
MVSALVLGMLVAGCGGGGGESSGSAATAGSNAASTEGGAKEAEGGTAGTEAAVGKAAFLKRANAICTAAKKKIEAQITAAFSKAASSGKSSGEDLIDEVVSTTVAASLQSRVDAIRALGMPSEGEAEVGAALDLMQEQVEEAKAAPRRFAESSESKRVVAEPVKESGLTACTLGWL